MSAKTQHLDRMLPKLDEMRDAVARAAHVDPDARSHQAHLMQARALRAIYGQITSTWVNTAQELSRTGDVADEDVELLYAERLGSWLRAHVADTEARKQGLPSDFSRNDRDIVKLYAARHFDMVAEYCETHAAALEERVLELRSSAAPKP